MPFEPVTMSFLRNLLEHNPKTHQNVDQVDVLNELLQRAQEERVQRNVTIRRAFRVFEIGYSLVLEQNDFRQKSWKPDPRVDIANIGAYEAILQEVVDRGTIYFVEAKLEGNELKEGVDAIRKTKMSRSMKGAERIIDLADGLRWLLTLDDSASMEALQYAPGGFDLVGNALANVCRIMAIGLTTQIIIAKELMAHE